MPGWTISSSSDDPDKWELKKTDIADMKETVDVTELDLPPENIDVLVEEVQD